VDVWLNNPTRMLEASGTSGMKVAANGGLNLSIGDGWWPEAYDGHNGWMIADGRVYEDPALQDQFDSGALYRLLEEEIVPAWFDRNKSGQPARWLELIRADLSTIPPRFNTDRMVGEYLTKAYAVLGRPRTTDVKALVQRIQRVRRNFGGVAIQAVEIADLSDVKVGETISVRVEARLDQLGPEDVVVELVLGQRVEGSDLGDPLVIALDPVGRHDQRHVFEGSHSFLRSGSFGYGIRVRPRTDRDTARALGDLALWA
jgi:starch phosphorylase